jgi:transcriptional regulator GlxA family with amidase domain
MRDPIRVSLAVFPQSDPSIAFGIFDTLWAAGRFWNALRGEPPGEPLFVPRLVGSKAGPLELITGVTVHIQDAVEDVPETDLVFVPNVIAFSTDELHALDRELLDWIVKMYRSGAHLYAACGAPLALAEAGLLDGLEATAHWGAVRLFRQAYPNVTVHPDRILVQTGPGQRIVCSGGASSWQDLVLFLVTKHIGPEEAIRLSKIFLYQWHKDGQLPYACMLQNVSHQDAVIRKCQTWIASNYDRENVVAELIRVSGLPERSFTRRFRAVTGFAPLAYVQALRIEEAKQMLETSNAPIDEIGQEVGYADPTHFRRLFKRLTGLTPAHYRRQFRVPKHILKEGHSGQSDVIPALPSGSFSA